MHALEHATHEIPEAGHPIRLTRGYLLLADAHRRRPDHLVAMALYAQMRLQERYSFAFDNSLTTQLGVTPRAKRKGLRELAKSGVISVVVRKGKCPYVLIENVRWFEELLDLLDYARTLKIVEETAKKDAAVGVQDCLSEGQPTGSLPPVAESPGEADAQRQFTVREAAKGFVCHRTRNSVTFPVPKEHHALWRAFERRLVDVAGTTPCFRLGPANLARALASFTEHGHSPEEQYIALGEIAEFLSWIDEHMYLREVQSQSLWQVLQTAFDALRTRAPVAKLRNRHLRPAMERICGQRFAAFDEGLARGDQPAELLRAIANEVRF